MLFLTAGAGMIFYFRHEKERLERQRVAEAAKGLGRPKVGGMFELLDHEGRAFTDQDMKGGFSLVSFKVFLVEGIWLGTWGKDRAVQLLRHRRK